jgi:hypothetical protein
MENCPAPLRHFFPLKVVPLIEVLLYIPLGIVVDNVWTRVDYISVDI